MFKRIISIMVICAMLLVSAVSCIDANIKENTAGIPKSNPTNGTTDGSTETPTENPTENPTVNNMIFNHNFAQKADLDSIPDQYVTAAKTLNGIYWHTSHGNQLITGLTALPSIAGSELNFTMNGADAALSITDNPTGWTDLGNSEWNEITRNYLNAHTEDGIDFIIWSWCGQVSGSSEESIATYLSDMSALETEFPNITFIYMTGHLDGSGEEGNLHVRNQQIRKYCLDNNKTLFDFADTESYDPDGNYYLDKMATDGCAYDSDNNGSNDKNWASDWQAAHTENVDWCGGNSDHTEPINYLSKAYLAWYMFARIAGWDGNAAA